MKVPVTDLREGMVLSNGHIIESVARAAGDTVVVTTRDLLGDLHESLEARATKYEVESVDITPSWAALVPVFIGVLDNDEAPVSARRQVEANLIQMARLADKYVQAVKNGSGDLTGLTPVLTDPDAQEGNA